MNLDLATIDVWAFGDDFSPESFLRQLKSLLSDGDVVAIGAYSPSQRLCSSLTALGAASRDAGAVYSVTFDLNRVKHPNGRSFEFTMSETLLDALVLEATQSDGQDDKPLFFDHVVAYRRGVPVVPLLCFHDAFSGGTLAVSALYSEAIIQAFASGLPSSYARIRNPANYPDPVSEAEAIFIEAVLSSDSLPPTLREHVTSVRACEQKAFDGSYLEFLREQIALQSRGPEWTAILTRRLEALSPYCDIVTVSGFIATPESDYYIRVDPRSRKVIHYEQA